MARQDACGLGILPAFFELIEVVGVQDVREATANDVLGRPRSRLSGPADPDGAARPLSAGSARATATPRASSLHQLATRSAQANVDVPTGSSSGHPGRARPRDTSTAPVVANRDAAADGTPPFMGDADTCEMAAPVCPTHLALRSLTTVPAAGMPCAVATDLVDRSLTTRDAL